MPDGKPTAPKPRDSSEEPVERTPLNVTLPPIDATPEEIAQALFQRPPKAVTGHASDRRKTGEKK